MAHPHAEQGPKGIHRLGVGERIFHHRLDMQQLCIGRKVPRGDASLVPSRSRQWFGAGEVEHDQLPRAAQRDQSWLPTHRGKPQGSQATIRGRESGKQGLGPRATIRPELHHMTCLQTLGTCQLRIADVHHHHARDEPQHHHEGEQNTQPAMNKV